MQLSAPLANDWVRLEPLSEVHRDALAKAAADPSIWTHMSVDGVTGAGLDSWFDGRLAETAAGTGQAYGVVRAADGLLVGSTSYTAYVPAHCRVEIGYTWYGAQARGTAINPATKLLLLDHAFDGGMRRVEFKTDARNARSRGALQKLGAVEEGILRCHMVDKAGGRRDSVYFSIIAEDWPKIRERLADRLARIG